MINVKFVRSRYVQNTATAERFRRRGRIISAMASHGRASRQRTSEKANLRLKEKNGATQPLSIVVVDDHRFMRDVICAMFARHTDRYTVVGQAANAADAVKVCSETQPNLVLLDINLPDRSGVDVVPEIKKGSPQTRILLCTAFVSDDRIVDALRSGADGFVEKTNTWGEFADAVQRVSKGEHCFAARSSGLASSARHDAVDRTGNSSTPQLSQRETEILTLIAHGRTSKEVAAELGISVATVDTHRTNLMSKLQIRNVAGLVVYAFRSGLITLHEGDASPRPA